jgi:hypothetical protein
MNSRVLNGVVVIQDQHNALIYSGKVIDQDGRERLNRQHLCRLC